MCLILVAWQAHPDYPLVVAANRDEFFTRPTARRIVLAGRRQSSPVATSKAGGTWMGITRRRPLRRADQLPRSRPASRRRSLARATGRRLSWQADEPPLGLAAQQGRRTPPRYNRFNLLVGDGDTLAWASQVSPAKAVPLEPGVYGLSNHLLDTPWPKVSAAKSSLSPSARGPAGRPRPCSTCCATTPSTPTKRCRAPASAWNGNACCPAAFVKAPGLRHAQFDRAESQPWRYADYSTNRRGWKAAAGSAAAGFAFSLAKRPESMRTSRCAECRPP